MGNAIVVLAVLVIYFLVLLFVSRYKSLSQSDNDAFFRAGRRSHWAVVAFGMIGASVSGVSFVSVPGWVDRTGMTYLQMCLGFFFGYLVIAFVLLPLYYRLRLTSIYDYLRTRFGKRSHITGAAFFIVSKFLGAGARLYLACLVLHELVCKPFGIPFVITSVALLLFIFLYTRRSGIHSIVRTDALQTACMLLALLGMLGFSIKALDFSLNDAWHFVAKSDMCRVLSWDWHDSQYFWRQFLSGMFITIVMTGLDQDMMQKNLTCSSLRNAQKDMCAYGICFLPVNLLFLLLGILLYAVAQQVGVDVSEVRGDRLMPYLVNYGFLGGLVIIPFALGISSAAFSSADSAMTALTTSICVDILGIERGNCDPQRAERLRKMTHLAVMAAMWGCIVGFYVLHSDSIIHLVYVMAGYTYGPLLGLFAFGLFCRKSVRDAYIPCVAIASPVICAFLDYFAPIWWDYHFGYELLMLNGLLTMAGCWLLSKD